MKKEMILGAQLYTVRMLCQTEPELADTLSKIAATGYQSVQVSGIGPIAPARVKAICDDLGLVIPVTHTPPDKIMNQTEQVIEDHQVMGAKHVGIGSMPKNYEWNPEGVSRFLDDFLPAAEKLKKAGMMLHYHNHHFEMARFEGKTLLTYMAEQAPSDLLGFILDTYWLQAGGEDPAAVIRRFKGRVPVIHLKDMAMRGRDQLMTPVLSGNMNFDTILEACEMAGCEWLMIEQDTCEGSPIDCLAESYRNLSRLGYR